MLSLFNLIPVAYADEPQVSEKPTEEKEHTSDEKHAQAHGNDDEDVEEEEEEDEDEDDEDDEDEDEEELVDPLVTLTEECRNTPAAAPFLHHFEHCVERVEAEQQEEGYADKHYKEDCVEEFFHLQHVINDCVAPRLFHKLK